MGNEEFEACMNRIKNGDRNGLKEIYNAYSGYLYHMILGIVKNREDAEDITSELFIRLWKTADRDVPGNGHKRYLSVIAHNMAVDFLRARNREIVYDPQEDENELSSGTQDNDYDEVLENLAVEQALEKLGSAEREIVHLKIIGDMTFQSIADLLRIPLGTVTWRYQQAVQKLRRYGYEA